MWWWGVGAQAVECAAPVTADRWRAALAAAEAGYRDLDAPRFEDALDGAGLDLPCVAEPLRPDDVARWHGLLVLRQYTEGRRAEAAASLAAARAAVPGWAPPLDLLPAGHELRALAPAAESPTETVPTPLDAATWFDGHASDRRPTARATVLQLIRTTDGRVATTAWLLPGDPLPSWPTAPSAPLPAPADEPTPGPAPLPARTHPRPGGLAALVVAGLAGSAAGGLALGAARAEDTFWSDRPEEAGWTVDRLGAQARTVNGLTVGAGAALGVAVGAAVVAGVAW